MILLYLIVSIWAIDKEYAIEGFLKFFPCVLYFFLLMQIEDDEKQKLWNFIPYSGAVMCILSCVLQIIPFVPIEFFSSNKRLIGFFQYSNTFALFLLLGIVILFNKEKLAIKEKIISIILILGILLTGSRTIFILFFIYVVYQLIKNRKKNKKIFSILASILIIVPIISIILLTGKNIETLRIFKISFTESTLIGRFIYSLDGLKILIKHPFGLGYMGYNYIYHEFQTANYITRFVHNDFLQQGLDTGIISVFILLYLFLTNIFSKKSNIRKIEMLIIIFIHMLLEFDLQFIIIDLIFVMLLAEQKDIEKINIKFKDKIITITLICIIIGVFGYFGIANFADRYGEYELALKFLPNKTSSNVQKISNIEDIDKSNELADKILTKNKYIKSVYNIKANYSFKHKKWEEMVSFKKQAINIDKYNIEEYEELVLIISRALDVTINSNDTKSTEYLLNELTQVETLINDVKKITSPLAYKIKDKPELDLNEDILNYIKITTDFKN